MEGLLSTGLTPSSLIASTWPENTKATTALTSEKVITLWQFKIKPYQKNNQHNAF